MKNVSLFYGTKLNKLSRHFGQFNIMPKSTTVRIKNKVAAMRTQNYSAAHSITPEVKKETSPQIKKIHVMTSGHVHFGVSYVHL